MFFIVQVQVTVIRMVLDLELLVGRSRDYIFRNLVGMRSTEVIHDNEELWCIRILILSIFDRSN